MGERCSPEPGGRGHPNPGRRGGGPGQFGSRMNRGMEGGSSPTEPGSGSSRRGRRRAGWRGGGRTGKRHGQVEVVLDRGCESFGGLSGIRGALRGHRSVSGREGVGTGASPGRRELGQGGTSLSLLPPAQGEGQPAGAAPGPPALPFAGLQGVILVQVPLRGHTNLGKFRGSFGEALHHDVILALKPPFLGQLLHVPCVGPRLL